EVADARLAIHSLQVTGNARENHDLSLTAIGSWRNQIRLQQLRGGGIHQSARLAATERDDDQVLRRKDRVGHHCRPEFGR
ncbi:MAG: hypothetical protein WCL11_07945, partial [Verrucomicrobiota bacterium]